MTVIVPADATETAQAIRAAAQHYGPVYIRLGQTGVPVIFGDDYRFSIGRSHILWEGDRAVVFACGIMVREALDATEIFARDGVEAKVVNASTIKLLEMEMVVEAARRTGAVVTVEEHSVIGGLGSAVAEVLCEHYPVPMEIVGIRDAFDEQLLQRGTLH